MSRGARTATDSGVIGAIRRAFLNLRHEAHVALERPGANGLIVLALVVFGDIVYMHTYTHNDLYPATTLFVPDVLRRRCT